MSISMKLSTRSVRTTDKMMYFRYITITWKVSGPYISNSNEKCRQRKNLKSRKIKCIR